MFLRRVTVYFIESYRILLLSVFVSFELIKVK